VAGVSTVLVEIDHDLAHWIVTARRPGPERGAQPR
jgi:hypothetical protein